MEARAELEEAKEELSSVKERTQLSESELAEAKAIADNAVERANSAEAELAHLRDLLKKHGISDIEQ